ncbi:MAG: phenylacetate-CoA oxygenase subunit PaaJ [Saprospiraceae bacterium]|nr:phenylacetate-CoA oxygenase subunit PaaJ [Saprospiraceae bacterium]
MVIDKLHIEDTLKQVTDPEIPVLTIQDLGIYQGFDLEGDKIIVKITPTYTGCPAMDMISVNVKSAMQEAGYTNVEVKLILSPTWTTDMISKDGLRKLKEYGIAPPVEKTTDKSYLSDEPKIVPCPQCESKNTEMISHFGSTACKALYKCLDCKEPFDYFKCY